MLLFLLRLCLTIKIQIVSDDFAVIDQEILSKMQKRDSLWFCNVCNFSSAYKSNVYKHVDAKHVNTTGYTCSMCHKFCPSINALKLHESRYHKNKYQ